MLHYYLNLPKDKSLDFDTNIKVSEAIMQTAKRSFEPFERYLQNVIEAMEKKEAQAKWKKVSPENSAELSIIGGLYEVSKRTEIQVSGNEKGSYHIVLKNGKPNFTKKLEYMLGEKEFEIEVSETDFKKGIIFLPGIEAETFDGIRWGFADIELHPAWNVFQKGETLTGKNGGYKIVSVQKDILSIEGALPSGESLSYNGVEIIYTVKGGTEKPKGVIISENASRFVVYAEQERTGFSKITNIVPFIADHKICFEDGAELKISGREGLSLILKNPADYNKIVIVQGIPFRIVKLQKNNKEAYRIQLLEIDDAGKDEDIQTLSPLRYFFDDDIAITDGKKNEYQIIDGRESENTLILKKKNEKGYHFPEGDVLTVKVNTYQLRKQLEAVSTLKSMPVGEHSRLIRLFENREKARWDIPVTRSVDEWFVITDETRSGCTEQRDFVRKALNTPDFAILEGPPGSGKTTVILELICQIAKLGQRVLLCGSTHVAIDNILERLKEKRGEEKSLLERFCILPVRIGDERRINEDIKEFQIDNLKKDSSISEELLLEAANLVCGTTIGILQHPQFKKRKGQLRKNQKSGKYQYSSDTPIVPEFDYLIIDESSKTTFQEFLVPALYAKKWILAGDVMQLSPFTERETIVSNLEQLQIGGKPLSRDLQDAVFYLQKLKECTRYGGNRFIVPVSSAVIDALYQELGTGRLEDFKDKIFLFITDEYDTQDEDYILVRNSNELNFLEMSVADIIFVDANLLEKIQDRLPERHAVLQSKKWENGESEHAFTHKVYQKNHTFSYKEKGKEFHDSFEIVKKLNEYFTERNWAEEVAWRVDSEHQLRMKDNKRKKDLTKYIEELLPRSLDKDAAEDAINSIAVMAFPSILESLVQGIKGSRKTKTESTISEGFDSDTLKKRRTTLVYQHRMHPDISRFPRERFYKNANALKDLENPSIEAERQWGYVYYPRRSVWINIDGETKGKYNEAEVKALMDHLKHFVEYAKNNPQPEGKEWTAACLTFYRGQETRLRERLQNFCKNEHGVSNFTLKGGAYSVNIKLHTVDKFQGHEADIVFLSMVQTNRVGFMDNPNRLNVALTRAKFQMVVFGKESHFAGQTQSDDLRELAKITPKWDISK